jgi:hypothetical protein
VQLLEAITAKDSDELAPVAAQHALAAIEAQPDDPDLPELTGRAVGLLRRAATRALALGAPGEAAGHLGRALGLVTDSHERHEIQLAQADACYDAARYDEAIDLAEAARAGFQDAGDADQEALASAVESRSVLRGRDDGERAVELVEDHLRRRLDTRGDPEVLYQLVVAYNLATPRVGRVDYSMFFEQVKLADRLRKREGVARAIINLGVQMMAIGAEELGVTLVEKGIVVARECHDPAQLGHGLMNLASVLSQSDTSRTSVIIDEAVDVARRSGSLMSAENAVVNQVINWWATGEWDRILATDVESLQPFLAPVGAVIQARVLAARGQDPRPVVEATQERDDVAFYRDLGVALGQAFAGGLADAVVTVRSALDRCYESTRVYDDYTLFYGVALEIALTAGDADLLDHLRRVVDEEGSSLPTGLQGHRALLGALDATRVGDPDDVAAEAFAEALARYATWGSPVHVARARAAYAGWLTRNGRLAEAEPLAAEARATYASLGAIAWLTELDEALSGQRVGS